MTLILKSMWRNVLRGSQLTKSVSMRSLTSSISELPNRSKPQDMVMVSIKSSGNAEAVLSIVQQHLPQMDHRHMLQALRTLFEIYRGKQSRDEAQELIRDPGFSVLCQNFKKHAQELDINEAIEATKVLSYLHVPVDSLIMQTMLQLVRCNLNFLNIRQVMFLDYLLRQFDTKNHLVDALKLALPLVFQIHLPLEIDNQDLMLLREMLVFSSTHDMPDRCINNIVTGLLLHDQEMNVHIAKSVVWSLCNVNCTEEVFPTRAKLLRTCQDVMAKDMGKLSFDDVLTTAARVKGRVLEKHPEYYNEALLDAIGDYVVENVQDFDKALLIARVLSRIAHTHLGLMEYLCQMVAADPTRISNARTNILFGFINCLSNNNYTPEATLWQSIRQHISNNPVLNTKSTALPWSKVSLELASLGHYEDKVIKRVFSKEFLDEHLARDENTLDYIQLLTLQEAVRTFHSPEYGLPSDVFEKAKALYPVHSGADVLEDCLARGLGGKEYVVKNVVLPSGIVVNAFMCLKGGIPVKIAPDAPPAGRVPLEQLNVTNDVIPVCIMNFHRGCYSLNSQRLRGTFRLVLETLEARGFAAVAINVHELLRAPPHERTPYLLREIDHKCAEIGTTLHSFGML